MIIGIDGNEANTDRRVGIGEFAFELLMQFSKFTVQSSKFTIYLKDKPKENKEKAMKFIGLAEKLLPNDSAIKEQSTKISG